ncbi:MAG: SurA N-terminal domain-containing protein [SAR324 cluster bacterium]|nr:SurA N-terminal domain-containing protein [SAR324 cluster bacterium]
MLDLIRNNVQSFGVKFIVGIVVMVMVFFGVSAYRNQGINTIATIDGYEIKVAKYQRAFEQAQNEIRNRFKSQAAEYMKMVNLPGQIVQQLVNSALLLKSAEKLGLSVTDYELAEAIFKTPDFQTDNRFDSKKYARMLTNNRIDKFLYEKDLRENLLSEKYVKMLHAGVLVSREYAENEYRRFKTEMTINLIEYKPDMFSENVSLTDAEIKDYYDRNKSDFQQKKQFVLKYFTLGINDTKDKIIVREKELKRYYEKNKNSEFSTPSSFLSRHILISIPADRNDKEMMGAKNKSDLIYKQLKEQPKLFPLLAEKNSADSVSAKKGGMLGWVEKGTFIKEFEIEVDNLQKNELSKPFLTDYGYHIVELLDKKPAEVKPFEEVKAGITETIQNKKAGRRLKNKVSTLISQFTDKALSELAAENNKEIVTSKEMDDSGNLQDIGNTYQIYQDIKSKQVNDRGYFNLSDDNGVLIYEISEVIDPFIKPLQEVRETVVLSAKSEKAAKVARENMVASQTETKSLNDFKQLALKLGVDLQTMTFGFSDRQSGQFRITDNFRTEVYKMGINGIKAVFDEDRNFLVFLATKKEGDVSLPENSEYEGLVNELKRQKANILISSLIGQMKKETEVEYNQSILSALDIKYN